MFPLFTEIILPLLALTGAAVGGSVTIFIYHKNSQTVKAKWLHSLFERFYCHEQYASIRQLIDYDSADALERLQRALLDDSDPHLAEQMVNYLNFFEFIASLYRLNQLSLTEICMLFDYYIRQIGEHDFLMDYLRNQGFEGLVLLIADLKGAC